MALMPISEARDTCNFEFFLLKFTAHNDGSCRKGNITCNRLFQINNLTHNSFILQQYVCHITILNMFRAAPCSSSGGQIVLPQPLVSSPSVNSRTVCRLTADCSGLQSALNRHTVRPFTDSDDTRCSNNTIYPPEDEQGTAGNMLRIIM